MSAKQNADLSHGECMTQSRFDRLPQAEKDSYRRAADARRPIEHIGDAIASLVERAGSGSGAPPYDSASLTEIYAPRIQRLRELQEAGYEYARWAWDAVAEGYAYQGEQNDGVSQ